MADPITEDALGELTYPLLKSDNLLVGRGGITYRADAGKILRPEMSNELAIPGIADFPTWVAQDSASATDIEDGFRITNTARGNSDNLSCRVRSLPGSAPWEITLGVRFNLPFYQYHSAGLVVRESATGKLEIMSNAWPNTHNLPCFTNKFDSPTSFNSTREEFPFSGPGLPRLMFFRMTRVVNTLQWYFSYDGVTFHLFGASFAVNNFFTTAPNQWGFYWAGRNQTLAGVVSSGDAIAWKEV